MKRVLAVTLRVVACGDAPAQSGDAGDAAVVETGAYVSVKEAATDSGVGIGVAVLGIALRAFLLLS